MTTPITDSLGCFLPGPLLERQGSGGGPLAGLRFGVKDIYDVAGTVTGWGNPDWARSHEAAGENAWAVQKLLDAGADIAGKTITDELAYSLNGQNFHFGTPTNPEAPGRIPGGSSSGSASAVAGGLVDFALGTDTGGSIRTPASFCGLIGLRTTHDRLPKTGVWDLAPSFDTVGWFARDMETYIAVAQVLLGEEVALAPDPQALIMLDDAWDLALPETRAALAPHKEKLLQRFGGAGSALAGEPGGGMTEWMLRFRHIQAREIWAGLGDWITTTKPKFGPEIQERFDWVQTITDDQAQAAAKEREDYRQRLNGLVGTGTVLCLPTAPGIAPRVDATAASLVDLRSRVLSLTAPSGLSGLPQITLPVARVDGCPVGISLIGPRNSDAMLLKFAKSFMGSFVGEA